MAKDHLDNEVSVSVSVSETGVEAKSRSRLIASIDRLGGAVVDLAVAPLEGRAAKIRARTSTEIAAIHELGASDIISIRSSDPARRALTSFATDVIRKQENKDGVIRVAIEHLKQQPPNEDEDRSGPNVLDDGFMSEFQRRAEDASTEELRERWGRVLASEIRSPGRFSRKVLRIIDELERGDALDFKRICQFQCDGAVLQYHASILPHDPLLRLRAAELITKDEPIKTFIWKKHKIENEKSIYSLNIGGFKIGIERPGFIKTGFYLSIADDENSLSMNGVNFTPVGMAIFSINDWSAEVLFDGLRDCIFDNTDLTNVYKIYDDGHFETFTR